ncbi:MAG: AAA family ATPase [Synergistaceae bacterium]|nr:AAA family ATPase [Synergistaceae bacterium]
MPVYFHFFGEPHVEAGGKRLEFPLKKAEAALYCVAYEGRLNRERLKTLLWGDKPEEQASGNLRNTIYLLRRLLPDNFITDRRHLLMRDFAADLELADALRDPDVPIDPVIMKEPMRGLDMKNGLELDEWLAMARNDIRRHVTDRLRERITSCYERNMPGELIESLETLLYFEPYDEDSMLELMEALRDNGAAAKAAAVFNSYRTRLESEIGAHPSERAYSRFKKLMSSGGVASSGRTPGEFFCCRGEEIERVTNELFRHGRDLRVIFIHGEAGVGKTTLVSRALELCAEEYGDVFIARPNSVGEKYPYSSWSGIVSEMGRKIVERNIPIDRAAASALGGIFYDFPRRDSRNKNMEPELPNNPVIVGRMLLKALRALSAAALPVMVFEDIHWFDPHSLTLLQTFLSELDIPAVIFLTSRPEIASNLSGLLYGVKTAISRSFMSIELSPFDPSDTLIFCRAFLPEDVIARKGEEYFQKVSEGSPLLLVETLRILSADPNADCSPGLRGVLQSRMQGLALEEREFLSVLSVFGSGASVRDMAFVMEIDERDACPRAETLLLRKFIRETGSPGEPLLDFLHSNFRDCVYDSIPAFRRKYLHLRIAGLLEAKYSPQMWNPELSEALRRHCVMGGTRDRMLKHYLQEMSLYIALNHDLFPLVEDRVLKACRIPFSNREDTEYKIARAGDLLGEINSGSYELEAIENRRLEASYLEIRGGYLISWGEYREGRVFINKASEIAGEFGFEETKLRCLGHIGHYFLQTDDAKRLLDAGRELLLLSVRAGDGPHRGMALRFIGMSMLLRGDFERAVKVFERSVEAFEELRLLGRGYTLNMLASRGYMGEMLQWTGNLDEAMRIFEDCVNACAAAGLFWGRGHFHAHAADAALDMGDWELVEGHIDEGSGYSNIRHGRSPGSLFYSLKAICDARRGMFAEAAESLHRGETLSAIGKKTWRAAQYMACAWIAGMRERNETDSSFDRIITHPSTYYAGESERLYREIGAHRRANLVKERFRK